MLVLSCWTAIPLRAQNADRAVRLDTATWLDTARARYIAVAIYQGGHAPDEHQQPVLISHGYNENLPGTYLHYSFLAEMLAAEGYFVVSIQHELPADEPLAMKGELRVLRMPNWERGAENILFVLNELKRTHPELDLGHTTLVGHSNGGDMSVLFATRYPDRVENLITLDNRRMPLPRTAKPHVLSLRSSDAPADDGVLPTAEEQAAYGIRIVPMPGIKHNEMSDRANTAQRAAIGALVLDHLHEP